MTAPGRPAARRPSARSAPRAPRRAYRRRGPCRLLHRQRALRPCVRRQTPASHRASTAPTAAEPRISRPRRGARRAGGTPHRPRSPGAAGRRRRAPPWPPRAPLRRAPGRAGACRSSPPRRRPPRRATSAGRGRAPSCVRGWRWSATQCPTHPRGSRRQCPTAPRRGRCSPPLPMLPGQPRASPTCPPRHSRRRD